LAEQKQKRGAKAAVVDYRVWSAMLKAYHKLKKKTSTIAEDLKRTSSEASRKALQAFSCM